MSGCSPFLPPRECQGCFETSPTGIQLEFRIDCVAGGGHRDEESRSRVAVVAEIARNLRNVLGDVDLVCGRGPITAEKGGGRFFNLIRKHHTQCPSEPRRDLFYSKHRQHARTGGPNLWSFPHAMSYL